MADGPETWRGAGVYAYARPSAGIRSASSRFLCCVFSFCFLQIRVDLSNRLLAIAVLRQEGACMHGRGLHKLLAWQGIWFPS